MEENQQEQPKMKVALIAALGQNRELGKDNQLLWHLGEDMQFFKDTTIRHYIIMGRKSFESIPKKFRPLPERVNIILSRDPEYMFEECYTCTSLSEALELANENGEPRAFIIGGGEIYRQAIQSGIVDEMYLTHVEASFPDAQVFFPAFNEADWKKTHVRSGPANSQNEYPFEIYFYEKISSSLNPGENIGSDVSKQTEQ